MFLELLGLINSSYPILLINNLVLLSLLVKYRMTFYLRTMILANNTAEEEFSTTASMATSYFI